MELLDVVLLDFGIVFFCASVFKGEWFRNLKKVKRMVDFLGMMPARIFYGFVGTALLFFRLYKYLI